MLKISNLSVYYGKISALEDISLEVEDGELVTVIGANGAGKTTLVKAIMGLLPIKAGKILFNGEDISKINSWERSGHRIAYVPEGSRVFKDLSVHENIKMGAFSRKDNKIDSDIDEIFNLFPRMNNRRQQLAGTLSGGEQQMLAIARGLVSAPKLLIIDEMSLGLMPILVTSLFNLIKELSNKNISILLIEQNAKKALEIANRGYLIENGRVMMEGDTTDFLINDKVKAAYLGG